MENTREVTAPSWYSVEIKWNDVECSKRTIDMLVKSFSLSNDNEARAIMFDVATKHIAKVGSYYKDIAASRLYRLLHIAREEGFDLDAKLRKITVKEEAE